jgi:hypothetical protein
VSETSTVFEGDYITGLHTRQTALNVLSRGPRGPQTVPAPWRRGGGRPNSKSFGVSSPPVHKRSCVIFAEPDTGARRACDPLWASISRFPRDESPTQCDLTQRRDGGGGARQTEPTVRWEAAGGAAAACAGREEGGEVSREGLVWRASVCTCVLGRS